MAKRRNPSTSTDAYHSVRDHVIPSHHQKILDALQKHGEGIYEEIAEWCGFKDKNSASRRLLELEKIFVVEKTERKKATSTGRMAFVYRMHPKFIYEIDLQNPQKHKTSQSAQNQVIQQSLFK